MKSNWLVKKSKDKLIVFFNGWGMDENPFTHLDSEEYDVLMFKDYKDLNIENIEEINVYKEVNVIAWSMGVFAANCTINLFKNINTAIAVNGTCLPVHDSFGIPEKIYNLTLNSLTDNTKLRFYRNMFSSDEDYGRFIANQPKRSTAEQKEELSLLKDHSQRQQKKPEIFFDRAIIGKQDKIFSFKSQLKFWKKECGINPIIVDYPHYIFYNFSNWEDIIDYD